MIDIALDLAQYEARLYRKKAAKYLAEIRRLEAEIEAMRQQHHKDLARAAAVARARMGIAMALKEHQRWRDASIGVAGYIDHVVCTNGTGDE